MNAKFMLAAAGAAVAGGAFAGPQVYDMTITVKEALCAGKLSAEVCGDKVYYKAQQTIKYQGMFWGCECDVIACPANYFTSRESAEDGFIFWNASSKEKAGFHNGEFKWNVLNVIGPKAQNVEGDWNLKLYDCDGNVAADLEGAGYGTVAYACDSEDNKIKTMAGNVVGVNDITVGSGLTGCYYCGTEKTCTAWEFCSLCAGLADAAKTAAFGTWNLKYNAGLTAKLAKGQRIDVAYKFPKGVLAEMACIEASGEDPVVDPTDDRKAKAVKNYKDAIAAQEAAAAAYKDINDNFANPAKSAKGKELADAKKAADDAVTAAEKVWKGDGTGSAEKVLNPLNDGAAKDLKSVNVNGTSYGAQWLAMRDQLNQLQAYYDQAKKDFDDGKTAKIDAKDLATLGLGADIDHTGTCPQAAVIAKTLYPTEALDMAKKQLAAFEKNLKAEDNADHVADQANYEKLMNAETAYEKALDDAKAAEQVTTDAKKAQTDALKAVNTWGDNSNTDDAKKTEGTISKALVDAKEAKDAADKAADFATLECISAGAQCF